MTTHSKTAAASAQIIPFPTRIGLNGRKLNRLASDNDSRPGRRFEIDCNGWYHQAAIDADRTNRH